jgi:hypothetical protein
MSTFSSSHPYRHCQSTVEIPEVKLTSSANGIGEPEELKIE